MLTWDDDGGVNGNFQITYELKAGETYELKVRWYSSETAGDMVIFAAPSNNNT